MGLGKFVRKGNKYLKERWADNKEAENAIKLEEARKSRETELSELTNKAEKFREERLKKINEYKNLRGSFDQDWEIVLNKSVDNEMAYLNALKGVDDKSAIEYLSNNYHLPEDEATILYKSLSKDKLKKYQNKAYKDAYYTSRLKEYAPNYKEYKDYKDYVIPNNNNNNTRNATEAAIPEAEAINTTARATTEVPKDPSNVGLFLKKALTSANVDGAIYGGAIGYQYPDESANTPKRLLSALSGALAGGYSVGLAGKGLKALKKPNLPYVGSILNKQNVLSLGRKLPAVPIILWDDINGYFKPTTSKPEDTSPPIGTPLGTPTNTYQQNTSKQIKSKW